MTGRRGKRDNVANAACGRNQTDKAACGFAWIEYPCRGGAKPQAAFSRKTERGAPATARKQKKGVPKGKHDAERVIAQNRKARHNYTVLDTLECGIMLVGSEVKSLRAGKVSLEEAYGRLRDGEIWLVGCDISEYMEASRFNHDPRRVRKLLLHRREIKRFAAKACQQGLTLVPLRMYFKEGRAKVLMGVCRGRKVFDKREAIKKASVKRDIQRIMRRRR